MAYQVSNYRIKKMPIAMKWTFKTLDGIKSVSNIIFRHILAGNNGGLF